MKIAPAHSTTRSAATSRSVAEHHPGHPVSIEGDRGHPTTGPHLEVRSLPGRGQVARRRSPAARPVPGPGRRARHRGPAASRARSTGPSSSGPTTAAGQPQSTPSPVRIEPLIRLEPPRPAALEVRVEPSAPAQQPGPRSGHRDVGQRARPPRGHRRSVARLEQGHPFAGSALNLAATTHPAVPAPTTTQWVVALLNPSPVDARRTRHRDSSRWAASLYRSIRHSPPRHADPGQRGVRRPQVELTDGATTAWRIAASTTPPWVPTAMTRPG